MQPPNLRGPLNAHKSSKDRYLNSDRPDGQQGRRVLLAGGDVRQDFLLLVAENAFDPVQQRMLLEKKV